MVTTLLTIIFVFSLYFLILIILKKKGLFERYNLSFYGPLLMWRTKRGKKFIERLSKPKRFWSVFAYFGMILCFVAMVFMVWLLIENLWMLQYIPKESLQNLPGINLVIAIPGINPILPIGYTIVGLVVAIVAHEFSHGIQCVLGKIKIKSLGLLAFIFPIGAFVEPDEDELKEAESRKRMRVFAAGPTMNLSIAFLCVLIISFALMPSLQPSDGAVVLYVIKDSPADKAGLESWLIITEINGTQIKDNKGFYRVMNSTRAGDNISISYHTLDGKFYTKNVILVNKYNFTNKNEDKGVGFLGVGVSDVLRRDLALFKNPFTASPMDFLARYYGAPFLGFFAGYNPLIKPFNLYYKIEGPLSILPSNVFWMIVNTFYWIFWLNFAVGLFNALPIIPFDGGFLLQDGLKEVIRKIAKKLSSEGRDRIVKAIMASISLFTLFLVLAPLIIKYLAILLFS